MRDFRVSIHVHLLEVMPASGKARNQIMHFIQSLAWNPHQDGDFTDTDAAQRSRQITVIGDYVVTYWADIPAKTVMVVDICKADQ